MARGVCVLGSGVTKFGELWEESFRSLIGQAGLAAVKDAHITGEDIDALYVGSMSAGRFIGQEHVGALVVDEAGLADHHIPATRVEAADASGAAALREGYLAIMSGEHDVVVVGGVEKMTDVIDQEQTNTLATALDQEWEAFYGATYPGVFALMAQAHMAKYGTTREMLAAVSVKNHQNGALNKKAAYPFTITTDQVLRSPMVADPIRMLDCAANVDGAAAVVLCSAERAQEFTDKPVKILASAQASERFAIAERPDITSLLATRHAATRAYAKAGVAPKDVDVAEVHDAFTITEIMAIEDLGFFEPGAGGKAALNGATGYKGERPVNTSGGLKARGHPPGATGLAQVNEILRQLRGDAGERQVADARIGLAHNVGGSGATAVVHLFGRDW
ncbi:MAG TPA: thiolase domain-containing protein [Candidatus Thermoplasmatota archaeon]|nr:thiolase domain-containing protein [Candidatus Thermoplasmatota archaeon]